MVVIIPVVVVVIVVVIVVVVMIVVVAVAMVVLALTGFSSGYTSERVMSTSQDWDGSMHRPSLAGAASSSWMAASVGAAEAVSAAGAAAVTEYERKPLRYVMTDSSSTLGLVMSSAAMRSGMPKKSSVGMYT